MQVCFVRVGLDGLPENLEGAYLFAFLEQGLGQVAPGVGKTGLDLQRAWPKKVASDKSSATTSSAIAST